MNTTCFQQLIWMICSSLTVVVSGLSGSPQNLPPEVQAESGPIVAVGGGGLPDGLFKNMIEMAGGAAIHVVVLPQASQLEGRGQDAAQEFRDQGAVHVEVVEFDNRESAHTRIEKANLIWFSGGDQSLLIQALQEAGLVQAVHDRHRAGAVIGGTSAGAAVMSELMITDSPDEQAIRSGNTPMGTGLALTPGMIIDQHFVERQRLNRLLSAVMDHPDRIGIGVSERTAIIVHEGRIEAFGDGSVIILDARSATTEKTEPGQLQSAQEIRTHVLRSGQEFVVPQTEKEHAGCDCGRSSPYFIWFRCQCSSRPSASPTTTWRPSSEMSAAFRFPASERYSHFHYEFQSKPLVHGVNGHVAFHSVKKRL